MTALALAALVVAALSISLWGWRAWPYAFYTPADRCIYGFQLIRQHFCKHRWEEHGYSFATTDLMPGGHRRWAGVVRTCVRCRKEEVVRGDYW